MDAKVWGFAIALLALCMSCTEKTDAPEVTQDDLVVAQVGDKAITAEQLREFSDNLPQRHQGTKTGLARARDHLQTMIDMELLLMEAQNERIAQSPDFVSTIEKNKKKKAGRRISTKNYKGRDKRK